MPVVPPGLGAGDRAHLPLPGAGWERLLPRVGWPAERPRRLLQRLEALGLEEARRRLLERTRPLRAELAPGRCRARRGADASCAGASASARSFHVRPLGHAGEQEGTRLLEHLARDYESLDFVRPLVDLRNLRVAHHALDRVLLDVAV